MVTPNVTHSRPKMMKGITLTLLSSIVIMVPLRVALAVFSDSLRLLARALWIGIMALKRGIKRPIPTASSVARQLGTIEMSA